MVCVLAPAMVMVQGVKDHPSPGTDMQISMNSAIHDAHSLVQISPPLCFVVIFLLYSQVFLFFFPLN